MTINFEALAAPMPTQWVKTRQGPGGKNLSYVTARGVMNRLDQVLGPENWRDEFRELPGGSVVCTIFIRVDGDWIGKSDVGTESDIEEDKGAFSDAFKRAAVKWGIARELYREGTAYSAPPALNGSRPAPIHWTRDPIRLSKAVDWLLARGLTDKDANLALDVDDWKQTDLQPDEWTALIEVWVAEQTIDQAPARPKGAAQ